jgi:hypothetical protein
MALARQAANRQSVDLADIHVAAAFFAGVLAFGLIVASVRFVPRPCIRAEIARSGKDLRPSLSFWVLIAG